MKHTRSSLRRFVEEYKEKKPKMAKGLVEREG